MGFVSLTKIFQDTKVDPRSAVICGMDEAGRGPWAGPVVAAAVVFTKQVQLPGLNDSKKLSQSKREQLHEQITQKSAYGVGSASNLEIDEHGIIKATNMAYTRALSALKHSRPDHLLIDGRDKFILELPYTSIIKGDQKVRLIACASIVAKVERDRIMREYAKKYAGYGFELHKGYGTRHHQQALFELGYCDIHRKSFHPISLMK